MTKSALELYQDVVLSHNREPRGYGNLVDPSGSAEGFNPICGDQVKVQILRSGDTVSMVGFTARCCALCRASASVLTTILSGRSFTEAEATVLAFDRMIHGLGAPLEGDAAAFAAIAQYPARAKCVLLPWKTFSSALAATNLAASVKSSVKSPGASPLVSIPVSTET